MTREMVVEGYTINDDNDCYVIAEIGHNHQGSVEKCKEMFDVAKECGAHAVKLQKRDNRALFTKEMYDSPYNSTNAYAPTYGEHREFLEFGKEEYQALQAHAKQLGITFFSTAFDFNSADFLADLDMPAYKIASGDLTNIPLLRHVAKIGKPMFISTGYASIEDIVRAYDAVMPINDNFCIMQCTAGYPPEYEELNIRVVETLRNQFKDIPIGFSSHDSGIAMAVVAYVLGARVVEKHFTLNRAWKGTDQAFSLERGGLRRVVRDLKRARIAMGDGIKRPYKSEEAPMYKMRKKVVAARELPEGHVLTAEDLALKVPNDGLPAYDYDRVIGMKLKKPVIEDETITFDILSGKEAAE